MKQEEIAITGGGASRPAGRRQLTQRLPLTAFSSAARALLKSPQVTKSTAAANEPLPFVHFDEQPGPIETLLCGQGRPV